MGEYKRLTKRTDLGCAYCEEPFFYSINRLAELEDDLERGKLIRLPCKVGDTVFFIYDYENSCGEIVDREIDKGIVDDVSHQEEGIWVHARYESFLTYWHKQEEIGKTVFLTREEAEVKLKELKDGKGKDD